MEKVTLTLTPEQVAKVKQALGIAEAQLSAVHKQILDTTVLVRGIELPQVKEQKEYAKQYHAMSCEMADLCAEITQQANEPAQAENEALTALDELVQSISSAIEYDGFKLPTNIKKAYAKGTQTVMMLAGPQPE